MDNSGVQSDIEVKNQEIASLRKKIIDLESQLGEAQKLIQKHLMEVNEVDLLKMKSADTLTKAKSVIFENTKMIKNQELQIGALHQQVESLRDVVRITKDLLEIRNLEVDQLETKIHCMEEKYKAEKERQDLMHQKLEQMIRHNGELKREYEAQLCLFQALRSRYDERELAKGVVDALKEDIKIDKQKQAEQKNELKETKSSVNEKLTNNMETKQTLAENDVEKNTQKEIEVKSSINEKTKNDTDGELASVKNDVEKNTQHEIEVKSSNNEKTKNDNDTEQTSDKNDVEKNTKNEIEVKSSINEETKNDMDREDASEKNDIKKNIQNEIEVMSSINEKTQNDKDTEQISEENDAKKNTQNEIVVNENTVEQKTHLNTSAAKGAESPEHNSTSKTDELNPTVQNEDEINKDESSKSAEIPTIHGIPSLTQPFVTTNENLSESTLILSPTSEQ